MRDDLQHIGCLLYKLCGQVWWCEDDMCAQAECSPIDEIRRLIELLEMEGGAYEAALAPLSDFIDELQEMTQSYRSMSSICTTMKSYQGCKQSALTI